MPIPPLQGKGHGRGNCNEWTACIAPFGSPSFIPRAPYHADPPKKQREGKNKGSAGPLLKGCLSREWRPNWALRQRSKIFSTCQKHPRLQRVKPNREGCSPRPATGLRCFPMCTCQDPGLGLKDPRLRRAEDCVLPPSRCRAQEGLGLRREPRKRQTPGFLTAS